MQPHLRKRSERLAAREAKGKISQSKGGNVQVPKDAAKSIHKVTAEIRREMSRRIRADREFNEKSRAKIAQPYRGQRGGCGTESYGDFAIIRFDGGGCVRPNLNIRVKHRPSRTWKYYEEEDMQDKIEGLKKDRFGYPEGFGKGGRLHPSTVRVFIAHSMYALRTTSS